MKKFGYFYLDREKDIIVELFLKKDELFYILRTPNHNSGNLITNLAKLCDLPITFDEVGLKIIEGVIPCYRDGNNQKIYIFRLGGTKVANIYPNGKIEMKASIPSLSKTLMSQTKNYSLDINKTIIKTYIKNDYKFKTDLHTHMNANLHPDILIALGIFHQIQYPLYYIKKLNLRITLQQQASMLKQRKRVESSFKDSGLKGKYLIRRIDDHTYINFADLILNNLENAAYNIPKIRASLSILKDGQAVFTNLEKVYLYRYVFTKANPSEKPITLKMRKIEKIGDKDIVSAIKQMFKDKDNPKYTNNSLFQNKLLWIARSYSAQGIQYVEMSDTSLVKKYASINMLKEVHEVMPYITEETGVLIRFLAAIRRTPLTIIKDNIIRDDYLKENLQVLKAVAIDPYVAGSDFVGEEINDIRELKPIIEEIVKIAKSDPSFVIRIHAGENDSLKDNVANSIECIKKSLAKGQKMPYVRLGHGLYTANLRSKKGQALLKELKKYGVVLEFQITSNVRLNNLTDLSSHPIKRYLANDIHCVQGSDGYALYGTTSIDEELALERMLNLSDNDLKKICETEELILARSLKAFKQKEKKFNKKIDKQDFEDFFLQRMSKQRATKKALVSRSILYDSQIELLDQIKELPWDRYPIIIAGGSFNNDTHKTKMSSKLTKLIDIMLDSLNPKEVFFVVGHSLSGYEKYLINKNQDRFKIHAIIPCALNNNTLQKIKKSKLPLVISIEANPMGLYKSFNYEIFQRRPFTLIALDGNSTGANLIQDAKNSKGQGLIFINKDSKALKIKADSLKGYVQLIDNHEVLINDIKKQYIKEKK